MRVRSSYRARPSYIWLNTYSCIHHHVKHEISPSDCKEWYFKQFHRLTVWTAFLIIRKDISAVMLLQAHMYVQANLSDRCPPIWQGPFSYWLAQRSPSPVHIYDSMLCSYRFLLFRKFMALAYLHYETYRHMRHTDTQIDLSDYRTRNLKLFLKEIFQQIKKISNQLTIGLRQANLVLIACASSEGSGEPAHPRSLARTFAARSYKQWVKRNLHTESQIPGPSEWLGMRS